MPRLICQKLATQRPISLQDKKRDILGGCKLAAKLAATWPVENLIKLNEQFSQKNAAILGYFELRWKDHFQKKRTV